MTVVERELGFRYELEGRGVEHYQEVCPRLPPCALRARAGRAVGGRALFRGAKELAMAKIPVSGLEIVREFGPHLSGSVRGTTSDEPDRLVKTHCCFCGQQCGIQLKVKDNSKAASWLLGR